MARDSDVRIIGDVESFIDSLLSHAKEQNCTHTVNDFLKEYFDKKNKTVGILDKSNSGTPATTPPSKEVFSG